MVEMILRDGSILKPEIFRLIPIANDNVAYGALFFLDREPQKQWFSIIEVLTEDNISSFRVEDQIHSASEYELVTMISHDHQYIQLIMR